MEDIKDQSYTSTRGNRTSEPKKLELEDWGSSYSTEFLKYPHSDVIENIQENDDTHIIIKRGKRKSRPKKSEVEDWGSRFLVEFLKYVDKDINEDIPEKFTTQIINERRKRYRPKKMEFTGWGSRALMNFLSYLGKDVSEQISKDDVAMIINQYVRENDLHHPSKKKKILCDDRLQSLFRRKMIKHIRIYDLLDSHYAMNQDDSDEDFFNSLIENVNNSPGRDDEQKDEKKCTVSTEVREIPKNCFAAVTPNNIKLVYLKRSLILDLLKNRESFETKIVGSYVRIKADPNDYMQKNSHLLVHVTGVKNVTANSDANAVLEVTYAIGDIQICKLSDDNFSEEECEDLRQRMKDGLLKQLTVGELEEKAHILHEDITKHWLGRELAMLQTLIDRANEKGWRKEMFEHLERRDLLQTPAKQAELLQVPKVIPDE